MRSIKSWPWMCLAVVTCAVHQGHLLWRCRLHRPQLLRSDIPVLLRLGNRALLNLIQMNKNVRFLNHVNLQIGCCFAI
ncbi:hypothetical protein QJS10_CPB15g00166 [Acorus calamus]|uniref:Secreted protein n=1 Tax=Acorus calamus TaxID=4465 RepID=A0AAV9DBL4_ACOCL|nr:hypothetical protein QJS10_CPB15g00166 [Acorus calamus]